MAETLLAKVSQIEDREGPSRNGAAPAARR
jgi:hypothetical protein